MGDFLWGHIEIVAGFPASPHPKALLIIIERSWSWWWLCAGVDVCESEARGSLSRNKAIVGIAHAVVASVIIRARLLITLLRLALDTPPRSHSTINNPDQTNTNRTLPLQASAQLGSPPL